MTAIVDPHYSGTLEGEIWRGVLGYQQRYLVSNMGRALSIYSQRGPRARPLLLKCGTYSKYGHKQIQLWRGGSCKSAVLARVTLEAFQGPSPGDDYDCAHIDSDPTNNRLDNLAWKTRKDNQHDRFGVGTDPQGERNPSAKLSNEQVVEMRRRFAAGESTPTLASAFGISYPQARRIVLGKSRPEGGTRLARQLLAA